MMQIKRKSIIGLLIACIALPTFANADINVPHLTLSANATIKAIPDMATLTFLVQATDPDASVAKQAVDQRIAHYFNFLKQQGIDQKEMNAANIKTQPKYEYNSDTKKSSIIGYTASRTVTVTLFTLDQLNPLLEEALNAGLNEIQSIQFNVKNPTQYQDQARDQAIKNALMQAEAVAKGFNMTLGAIYSINYRAPQAVTAPRSPIHYEAKMVASDAFSEINQTYEQQTMTFSDQVDVVFEIK